MPTYEIKDFVQGMDLRKMYTTAPAGSLRLLRNAVITPGAEIEKRNAFTTAYTAPAGSFGLLTYNAKVYTVVVGGTAGITPPSGSNIGIVRIPAVAGVTFTSMNDWDVYHGIFYIVMAGNDGKYYHFWNYARVTDANADASFIRTYGNKVYGLSGSSLKFSASNNCTLWTVPTDPSTNAGQGAIDLSSQDADSTTLVGMEVYYDQMAIFSTLSTQFWSLLTDPNSNLFKQLLRKTGLVARHAVTQFGSGDVMYLSPFGIRSLRIQNISLTAGTTDIGTPIDIPVRDLIWTNGIPWFHNARMLIQPRTGRLWVVLPDRVYVLSTFQQPAITAWSVFDFVDFPNGVTIVDSCVADPYVYIRRSDNVVMQYGGVHLDVYDSTQAEVITPAMSMDKPNKMKLFNSFDIACEGQWDFSVSLNPNDSVSEELVATVIDSTFPNGIESMPGQSTHFSLRLRTTDASAARIGQITVQFEDGEDK